jgi:hypothetical protein
VRIEERGVVAGDDELHLAQHVEGTAARDAVHRGDDRLPEVTRLRPEVAPRVVVHPRRRVPRVVAGGHRRVVLVGDRLAPVDARAERLSLASEDHAPDVVVVAERGPQRADLVLHLLVDGVADVRSVQRHPHHAVVLANHQRLVVGHGPTILRSRPDVRSSRIIRGG